MVDQWEAFCVKGVRWRLRVLQHVIKKVTYPLKFMTY